MPLFPSPPLLTSPPHKPDPPPSSPPPSPAYEPPAFPLHKDLLLRRTTLPRTYEPDCPLSAYRPASQDYLAVVLAQISKELSLPPRLAGVTIVAIGNGAPDISATAVGGVLVWPLT